MLELRTFGALTLLADHEPLTGGAAGQRKPLALLLLLASAWSQGLTRERLLGYLWPELDEERGRRVLRQTLYALRRDLALPQLFLESTAVRLNPAHIDSDAPRFAADIAVGRWQAAAETYRGPFVDGFYLSGAEDFERWVESERASLARQYREALEHLAVEKTRAGAHAEAVAAWRRLVNEDPLNGRTVVRLMEAHVAAGTFGAALECARAHEELSRRELGAALDPVVAQLADAIRHRMTLVTPPSVSPMPPEPANGEEPAGRTPAGQDQAQQSTLTPSGKSPSEFRGRRWMSRAAGAAVLIGGLAVLTVFRAAAHPAGSAVTLPDDPTIAVLPFKDESLMSGDRELGQAFAGELARQLGLIGGISVIGPENAAPRSPGRSAGRAVSPASPRRLLEGTVRLAGDRLTVQARLVDDATGVVLWASTVERNATELYTAESYITRSVLTALKTTISPAEGQRLDHAPTADATAYRLYLKAAGLAYSTRAENEAGIELLRQALQRDSTFALAEALLARRFMFNAYLVHPRYQDSCRASVQRALALDPGLSLAHLALGDLQVLEGRPATARFAYLKAMELSPSEVGAMADLSDADATIGRYDESLYWAVRGLRLVPTAPWIYAHVGVPLSFLATDTTTSRWLESAERRWPDLGRLQIGLMREEMLAGDEDAALARGRRLVAGAPTEEEGAVALAQIAVVARAQDAESLVRARLSSGPETRPYGLLPETFRTLLALLRDRAGDRVASRALLDTALTRAAHELKSGGEDPAPAVEIAAIHALRGDAGEAVSYLELAHQLGWKDYRLARRDPFFGPLQSDPRFAKLVRAMTDEVAIQRRRAGALEDSVLAIAIQP